MQQTVLEVTERIVDRSRKHRDRYLRNMEEALAAGPSRHRLPASNLAHAMAVCRGAERERMRDRPLPPHRHRHLLQRRGLGPPHLRELSRDPQEGGGRGRRRRPGRGRRARDVRRGHPGRAGDGPEPDQPRRDRDGHGDRALAQRVRRRAAARHLRQDPPRAADGRAAVRAPAGGPGAGRPDALGALQQGEGPRPGALRRGENRRRGDARGRVPFATTAPGPAPSTAPPTATSSSRSCWGCTCPAPPSSTPTTRCARRSPSPPAPASPA